jgi:hypothetical protein
MENQTKEIKKINFGRSWLELTLKMAKPRGTTSGINPCKFALFEGGYLRTGYATSRHKDIVHSFYVYELEREHHIPAEIQDRESDIWMAKGYALRGGGQIYVENFDVGFDPDQAIIPAELNLVFYGSSDVIGTFNQELLEKTLEENAKDAFKYRIDKNWRPNSEF